MFFSCFDTVVNCSGDPLSCSTGNHGVLKRQWSGLVSAGNGEGFASPIEVSNSGNPAQTYVWVRKSAGDSPLCR